MGVAVQQNVSISPERYSRLCEFMYAQTGVVLTDEKRMMVTSRLQKRANQHHSCLNSYLDFAMADKHEAIQLISALTTHKTHFFREARGLAKITEHALTLRNSGKQHDPCFKVWSAACSSGEEAYSVAMWLAEVLNGERHVDVLGTDICEQVLRSARRGIFPNAALENIGEQYRQRFILSHPSKPQFKIRDKLADRIRFRRHNLIASEYPMNELFDAILCRNVMIYFDLHTRQTVVNQLVGCLKVGGLLVVGSSESTPALHPKLRQVEPSIFERTR